MQKSVELLQLDVENNLSGLVFPSSPASLYEPFRYMLALGGKRMRPVLVLMASKMFGGNEMHAMPAALGIEVFHNFTLLHDDIMDNAPLRRGKATVHEKWNPNIAILSGDAMFVKACQLMSGVPSVSMPSVMEMFLKTAMEVCEGQQLDMDFEKRSDVSIPEYLEMIRLKTAVLLGGSLAIGADVAKASVEAQKHLYDFGVNLGLAFQLQDDILDVFGDAAKFGKQEGGDIIANKKTYLLLTAKERATGALKDELWSWLNHDGDDHGAKVNAVKRIYDELEVREAACNKMDELYGLALDHLHALSLSTEQIAPLKSLADYLMAREN